MSRQGLGAAEGEPEIGDGLENCWAIEVDMATESLPTLRPKLLLYVDLAPSEERLPGGDRSSRFW